MMDAISYSAFRSNLAKTLDKVNEDHVPVLITRQNGKAAVVISLEDFKSYEETAYLMTSLKSAEAWNPLMIRQAQHERIQTLPGRINNG